MTIRELLERSPLPGEAGQLLDQGPLPREEKERVLALALEKAGLAPVEKGETRTMKKTSFGFMLLAAALCVGTVAASALGYFTMNKDLARHLNAGEKENALVSQAGQDLGATATAEGWTITASQVLGDRTQMRVLLDVTAPEGTVLEEGNYRLELPMLDPAVTFTIDDVKDEDPADNKLSFVLSSITAKDYRGEKVKLHIGGVSRYKKYTVEELDAGASPLDVDKLVTGDFDLSFDLDYQDTSVTYKPDAEVDTPNGKVKVDEVVLSPLSIFVKLSGEGTVLKPGTKVVIGGEVSAFQVDDKGNIVKVDPEEGEKGDWYAFNGDTEESSMAIFHDGSTLHSEFGIALQVMDKDGNTIEYRTGDTQPDSITMTFTEIIDPDDVDAIVLQGMKIPLVK